MDKELLDFSFLSNNATTSKRDFLEDEDEEPIKRAGRRKIQIEYIEEKSRRHITFSKRKAGIMKKAYELSTLTGTQVLLLVASETGHVYTFATPKLQPIITQPEGKNLIQACLNAQPDIFPTEKPFYQPPTTPFEEEPQLFPQQPYFDHYDSPYAYSPSQTPYQSQVSNN